MSSINLVLRSRPKVGVSKDATGEVVPAAILRDAVLRAAPQDEVRVFYTIRPICLDSV